MNKYSGMSDREINELVINSYESIFPAEAEKIISGVYWKRLTRTTPSICSSYHNAFKLMIDNGISLTPIIEDSNWVASKVLNYKMSIAQVVHKNPCRAIAECYLLIKDAENE